MSNLERESVKAVRQALMDAGINANMKELNPSVRTAQDAADALGVELGAIVRSLVFTIGPRYVIALVASDHVCVREQLAKAFRMEGDVISPPADLVRAVTGYVIGGVSPVPTVSKLPTIIDASLKRFESVYVCAGHSHCVLEITLEDLKTITNGTVSYAVAVPDAQAGEKIPAAPVSSPKAPQKSNPQKNVQAAPARASGQTASAPAQDDAKPTPKPKVLGTAAAAVPGAKRPAGAKAIPPKRPSSQPVKRTTTPPKSV